MLASCRYVMLLRRCPEPQHNDRGEVTGNAIFPDSLVRYHDRPSLHAAGIGPRGSFTCGHDTDKGAAPVPASPCPVRNCRP